MPAWWRWLYVGVHAGLGVEVMFVYAAQLGCTSFHQLPGQDEALIPLLLSLFSRVKHVLNFLRSFTLQPAALFIFVFKPPTVSAEFSPVKLHLERSPVWSRRGAAVDVTKPKRLLINLFNVYPKSGIVSVHIFQYIFVTVFFVNSGAELTHARRTC